MKKLVLKEDFAFIYLNKSFYTKELIIKTLSIYKEFFNSSINELGKYIVLKLELVDTSFKIEELSREYLNYLLSEQYQKK